MMYRKGLQYLKLVAVVALAACSAEAISSANSDATATANGGGGGASIVPAMAPYLTGPCVTRTSGQAHMLVNGIVVQNPQWSSSDETVLTVSSTGVWTWRSPGHAVVTAKSPEGKIAQYPVDVEAANCGTTPTADTIVTKIVLIPDGATHPQGSTQQFSAKCYNSRGEELFAPRCKPTFSSSQAVIIAINPETGFANYNNVGSSEICAKNLGTSGTGLQDCGPGVVTSVTVTPVITGITYTMPPSLTLTCNSSGVGTVSYQISWQVNGTNLPSGENNNVTFTADQGGTVTTTGNVTWTTAGAHTVRIKSSTNPNVYVDVPFTVIGCTQSTYSLLPANPTITLVTTNGVCGAAPVTFSMVQSPSNTTVPATFTTTGGGTFSGSSFTATTAGSFTVTGTATSGGGTANTTVTVVNNCTTPTTCTITAATTTGTAIPFQSDGSLLLSKGQSAVLARSCTGSDIPFWGSEQPVIVSVVSSDGTYTDSSGKVYNVGVHATIKAGNQTNSTVIFLQKINDSTRVAQLTVRVQ